MSPSPAMIEDPDTSALSWAHAICVELLVGPCTTSELAAITGRDFRKLSAHTCHLIKRGLVEVYGEFLSETNQPTRIYGLTPTGRGFARSD